MFKFNLFLTLVLVLCALSLVNAQNEARKLNMALENERKIARKFDVEWKKLQLEQSTLVARRKIENAARRQLDMDMPVPKHIQIITASQMSDSQWVRLEHAE